MNVIPITQNPIVIRTDFTNESIWNNVKSEAIKPSIPDGFSANLEFVENLAFNNSTIPMLIESLPQNYPHPFIILFDHETVATPNYLLCCIDLIENKGDFFRFAIGTCWSVENNLSLGNLSFEDFKTKAQEKSFFDGF